MVTTRRSQNSATTTGDGTAPTGTKRKEHATSPKPEHDTKAAKTQTTIEDTIDGKGVKKGDETTNDSEGKNNKNATQGDTEMKEAPAESIKESARSEGKNPEGVETSSQREDTIPSSVLEKGIIYFLTRNRVGIEDTKSIGDLQRTFFVLRPLPAGAKLVDGAIPDSGNNRLLALPKKHFPQSHDDRFMAFVQKSKTTIQDLKENFFQGSEYDTKTSGTRHVDPITPVGEGVYVLARTKDKTTHLVYAITVPTSLGDVQRDLGLRPRGTFIISVKNPERSGPASASLPEKPEFPKEIIEEFRGLAWAEVKPEYLEYPNCQILLIGEHIENVSEPHGTGLEMGKSPPMAEIAKLEHEDELRVKHLDGNDTIFADLDISKSEYPELPTTW